MAFLQRESGQIHYAAQGKGEPLLILRGLGRSSRYWLGFEKQLAKVFKVIQIDLRGLGRTSVPMGWADGIDDLAEDCVAVLDQLKIKRAHVFGLSLGGMVALRMGSLHPERCRSLMVANSSSADYPGFRVDPFAVKDIVLGRVRGRLHEALLARTIPSAVAKVRGEDILKQWAAIRDEEGLPLNSVLKQIAAAARFTIRGRLKETTVPVLFLYGTLDGLVPHSNTRRMHRLVPGAALQEIKGASHEIHVGHETQLVQVLRDFCEQAS
ncbi:MAG TPA: alpha/beta hydrolase [Oligoflexus sp.]|uniref:alpha/beta fold hydrolase n=1 Tax=Oligoflexus sp. TaxID=1971216 RepID=UPI002D73D949|nr:alpha/beta hydrolase [Oligoflexus sp.]HYX32523.1 alpha/beta hydrolase [Oligoflexus sp.]